MELFRIEREECKIRRLKQEATHVREECVGNGPFREAC